MTIKLNELSDNKGARKGRMRVGRGIGAGEPDRLLVVEDQRR